MVSYTFPHPVELAAASPEPAPSTYRTFLMSTSQRSEPELDRLDCSAPGRGAWKVLVEPESRRVRVRHNRTASAYTIFYGTRTERTRDDAETYATAMCAVLNALKAKRC